MFFSLTLQSRAMIHRHTKNENGKGVHQFHLRSKRYFVISPHGFSLVKAAVACAILERISGFATSKGIPERDVAKSSVVPRQPSKVMG